MAAYLLFSVGFEQGRQLVVHQDGCSALLSGDISGSVPSKM